MWQIINIIIGLVNFWQGTETLVCAWWEGWSWMNKDNVWCADKTRDSDKSPVQPVCDVVGGDEHKWKFKQGPKKPVLPKLKLRDNWRNFLGAPQNKHFLGSPQNKGLCSRRWKSMWQGLCVCTLIIIVIVKPADSVLNKWNRQQTKNTFTSSASAFTSSL